jgi:hypothetical protein
MSSFQVTEDRASAELSPDRIILVGNPFGNPSTTFSG